MHLVLCYQSTVNGYKKTKNMVVLTEREKEVVASLAEGNSYKIIADKLFISTDTVRGHIRHIYKKLHVNTKSGAVAKAIRIGILSALL